MKNIAAMRQKIAPIFHGRDTFCPHTNIHESPRLKLTVRVRQGQSYHCSRVITGADQKHVTAVAGTHVWSRKKQDWRKPCDTSNAGQLTGRKERE